MKDKAYEKAKKKVKKKKGFYAHLSSFISVGVFFVLINIATFKESQEWWFFFPMIPWGIGLMIHYFSVFGLPVKDGMTQDWEEKEIEKELQKIRKKEKKFITKEQVDDDPALELKEFEKMKNKKWDEEDFV